MTISSASLFRAFTTSNINNTSSYQSVSNAEPSVLCELTTGFFSWHQTRHREHKKNEFSELTRSILDEFAKNENSPSITIRIGNKNLVVSERPGYIELVFGEETNTLENMKLKDFIVRLRLDMAVNAELYSIAKGERERPSDTDLADANLRNMNLSGADLSGANLTGANLSGANLSGADLSGAILYGANLLRVDLTEANLSGAMLYGVNLSEVNLTGANLLRANLLRANLSGVNLSGVNLSGINLTGANLSGANLSGVNLSGVNLTGANLSGADLTGANLTVANLSRANLTGANLTNSNLPGVNLLRADLLKANLKGANLKGANLSKADLSSADLTGANLSGANLSKANLSGTRLQNTTIHLQLPTHWGQAELDDHFNHLANGSSLLMTVNNIDDSFSNLKIELIHQILKVINQPHIDLSPFYKNFSLLLNSSYYSDDTIKTFVTSKVIRPTIEQANSQAWTGVVKKMCEVLLGFVESTKDFDYVKNNGFFVQLIFNSLSHNDTALAGSAERLYEHYLSLERIKPFIRLDDFGVYGENRVDWSDPTANNYVLVCDNRTILISSENLESMLATDRKFAPWNHFFLYRHDMIQNLIEETPDDMGALFKAFKIFDQQYQFYKNTAKFVGILDLLNLGDYHADFIAALDKKPTRKIITSAIQLELGELFANVMNSETENPADTRIRPEHYRKIVDKFELTDAEETVKAQTLFCLATVFTRYSSSYFFGTAYNSPQAIRQYAYALMNEAKFQHPGMIDISQFNDLKNRLLGLNRAFTCTAVLSTIMIDYAREKFPHILNGVLPPAWK